MGWWQASIPTKFTPQKIKKQLIPILLISLLLVITPALALHFHTAADSPLHARYAAFSIFNHTSPQGTVLDAQHHRLFVASGTSISVLQLNTNNQPDSSMPSYILGDAVQSTTTANTFTSVGGLAYDTIRNLLFVTDTDHSRILVFDVTNATTSSAAIHVIGQPSFTASTENQGHTLTEQTLSHPSGLAYDNATKYLYATDTGNNRVMVFDTTVIENNMASSFVLGQSTMTSNDTGEPSQTTLTKPSTIVLDSSRHELFVGSGTHGYAGVVEYDTTALANGMPASHYLGKESFTTAYQTSFDARHFVAVGLMYDEVNQRLFVEDRYNRIFIYNLTTGITDTMPADDIIGADDYTNTPDPSQTPDAGSITSLLAHIDAYDPTSNTLYVSDTHSNRILLFRITVAGQKTLQSPLPVTKTIPRTVATKKIVRKHIAQSPGVTASSEPGQSIIPDNSTNVLNSYPSYLDGKGYRRDISAGDVLYFNVVIDDTKLEQHTFKIESIDYSIPTRPTVAISVGTDASFTATENSMINRDATGDNRADITLSIDHIEPSFVTMTFWNATAGARSHVTTASSTTTPHVLGASETKRTFDAQPWFVAGSVITALFGVTLTLGKYAKETA